MHTATLAMYNLGVTTSTVQCPFCRQTFSEPFPQECPQCSIALDADSHRVSSASDPSNPVDAANLRAEAHHHDDDDAPTHPDETPLPFFYLGRFRGALILVSLVGLAFFFLPWVHAITPRQATFTGYDISRRTGVTWSVAVAWFTLLPLVISRRNIIKMRGARLAAAVLSSMPAIAATALLAFPPGAIEVREGITITNRFEWGAGIYLTIICSVIAIIFSVLFGGKPTPPSAPPAKH